MAAQALTISNTAPSSSMPITGKNAIEDRGSVQYFATKSVDDTPTAVKDTPPALKAGPTVKDSVKRGHAYVNLPTHLPLSSKTQPTHFSNNEVPAKPPLNANLIQSSSSTPGGSKPDVINEKGKFSGINESTEDKSDKFSWPPRCPPDGAAVYDTSPTNSSVSSSPVIKSHSALMSVSAIFSTYETRDVKVSHMQDKHANNANQNSHCAAANFIFDNKTPNKSHAPISTTSVSDSVHSTSSGLSHHTEPNHPHKSQVSLYSKVMSQSVTEAVESIARTSISSPPLPLPPPPDESPSAPSLADENIHYYHEHARAEEMRLDSARKPCKRSESSNQSKSQSPNSSTQSALPPPPKPTSAPAVPRRDPNTVLQSSSEVQVTNDAPVEQCSNQAEAQPKSKFTGETTTAETPVNSFNMPPDPPVQIESSALTPADSSEQYLKFKDQTQRPFATSTHSELTTPSSCSQTTPKHTITRPIPIKTSPDSEVHLSPVSYQRHNSLPAQPTIIDITDGRTVVPWNPKQIKNSSIHTSMPVSENTLEEAVTAALSSQSTTLPDATPQWIPPEQSVVKQRFLSSSSGKKVEFVNHGTVKNTQVSVDSTQDLYMKKDIHPTSSMQQMVSGRAHSRPQRSQTQYVSSRSERGVRRHHTTSELEALRLIPEKCLTNSPGSSVKDKRFSNDPIRPTNLELNCTTVNRNECHPLSPKEAAWWRAQQRSKMLSSVGNHNVVPFEILNAENMYLRQFSAEPTMKLSPTSPQLFSSSDMFALDSDSSRARFIPVNSHEMAQPLHRRQFLEDSYLLNRIENTSAGYNMKIPYQIEQSMQYLNESRQFLEEVDLHRSKSIPKKYREQIQQKAYDADYQPDMTRSVLSPPLSGWQASYPTSMEHKQTSSSSGRRRRSKNGILRSQSHRAQDQSNSRQLVNEEGFEGLRNEEFPVGYYQRSISQTVPAQTDSSAWPMVLIRSHYRRPVMYAPDMFDAQSDSRWHPRKELHTKSGQSIQDLAKIDGRKRLLPHHHSASAIFDRLDMQPWFHFDLPRAAAERLLKAKRVGSFLVRQSETCKSEYSLSIRRENDVLHMKISNDPDTGYFVLGEYSQPYPSISAMIYRYTKSLLPVRGSTPILLQYPVERSTQR